MKSLAVAALLVAAATAILGFLPGSLDAELGTRDAGGGGRAILVAFLALPAVAALVRPTPRVLLAWSLVAWLATFFAIAGRCKCEYRIVETYVAGTLAELGTRLLMHATCWIVPLCIWLLAASRRRPAEDTVLAMRIRVAVRLAFMLAVALAGLYLLAADDRLYMLELVSLTVVPGVLLRREPTWRNATFWMVWALPMLALLLLDSVSVAAPWHAPGWAERAMLPGAAALATVAFAVVPCVFLVTREVADRVPRATGRNR